MTRPRTDHHCLIKDSEPQRSVEAAPAAQQQNAMPPLQPRENEDADLLKLRKELRDEMADLAKEEAQDKPGTSTPTTSSTTAEAGTQVPRRTRVEKKKKETKRDFGLRSCLHDDTVNDHLGSRST